VDWDGELAAGTALGRSALVGIGAGYHAFRPAPWSPTGGRGDEWSVFASLSTRPSQHLQGRLTARLSLTEVTGGYFEATATSPLNFKAGSRPRVFLSGLLAVAAGEAIDPASDGQGYYARDGMTHGWLEVAWQAVQCAECRRHRRTLQLFARVQGNFDPLVKRRSLWSAKTAGQYLIIGAAFRATKGS
jgi:hypothetical protein